MTPWIPARRVTFPYDFRIGQEMQTGQTACVTQITDARTGPLYSHACPVKQKQASGWTKGSKYKIMAQISEAGLSSYMVGCCDAASATLVPEILQTAGLIGVAVYLGSFAALQVGLLGGNSNGYTIANLVAASLVLTSLFAEFNMASALIQISWIIISLTGLTRRWLGKRRLRFSPEETDFLSACNLDLPKAVARRLMDAGTWSDAVSGQRLLVEREPVANLFYVLKGRVRVSLGGQHLADFRQGFLGEINISTGLPASATVTVVEASRIFTIPRHALVKLMKTDNELLVALSCSMLTDTGRKLVAQNNRLTNFFMPHMSTAFKNEKSNA